jgi:hypothetical protein
MNCWNKAAKMWDGDKSWTHLHTTYKELLVSQQLKNLASVRNFEVISDKFNAKSWLRNKCRRINIYIYIYVCVCVCVCGPRLRFVHLLHK